MALCWYGPAAESSTVTSPSVAYTAYEKEGEATTVSAVRLYTYIAVDAVLGIGCPVTPIARSVVLQHMRLVISAMYTPLQGEW